MALYQYDAFISKTANDKDFDFLHKPGSATPFSGIYRCHGCGREVVSEHNKPFPPQNHHQHAVGQGAIEWRLIVWANGNPS
jgi:hypothetical protein